MTDTATTPTAPQDVQEPAQDVADEPQETTEPDAANAPENEEHDGSKAGRDAARYRRQLRETEAERDGLRATVETLRTAAAEAALAGVLAKPGALWLTGVSAADFYDDDGVLDVARLRDAATDAARAKGLAGARRFGGSANGGASDHVAGADKPSFADAFKA